MTITHAYAAEIVKYERDADGDLIVYGKATGPDLDLDAQICDPAWLRKAMPEWMEWGNIREMHGPIAAGVGIELEEKGDGWWLKSKCVDPTTARKIEQGVLKGYSVGIKNPRVVKDAAAPGGRINGGSVIETSYVDRPCNPTATLAICKAVGGQMAPVNGAGDVLTADPCPPAAGSPDPVFDRDRAVLLVKAVAADGTVDERPDIEGATQAIELIAGLIQAEAAELAAGRLDETHDISLLLRAVEALKVFLARERAGTARMDEATGYVSLAADAGTTKGATGEGGSGAATLEGLASQVAELGALVKSAFPQGRHGDAAGTGGVPGQAVADGPPQDPSGGRRADPAGPDQTAAAGTIDPSSIDDLVQAAVAKATKPLEERAKALEAELSKVKATPIPGGPVITRATATTPAHSESADKAAYYRRQASQVTDPHARAGYLKLADDAERGI